MGGKKYLAGALGALVGAQRSIRRTSRGMNPSRAGSLIWLVSQSAAWAVPQSQSRCYHSAVDVRAYIIVACASRVAGQQDKLLQAE